MAHWPALLMRKAESNAAMRKQAYYDMISERESEQTKRAFMQMREDGNFKREAQKVSDKMAIEQHYLGTQRKLQDVVKRDKKVSKINISHANLESVITRD